MGGVRLDGDEVVGDDGHVVAVNGEALDTFGASVDQAETMNLASGELELGHASISGAGGFVTGSNGGAVKVHLAVDEIVVGPHRGSVSRGEGLLHKRKVRGVIPVRQHHRAKIDVVVGVLGAIDDDRAKHTIRVLRRVVRVVPRGSVQLGLELVRVALARGNRALVNTRDTILPRGSRLQETVPVKSGALLRASDVVVQSDLDRVAPVSLDRRSRVGTVDEEDGLLVSIRGDGAAADGEVVGSDDTCIGRRGVRIGISGGRSSPGKPSRKRIVGQEGRQLGRRQSTKSRRPAQVAISIPVSCEYMAQCSTYPLVCVWVSAARTLRRILVTVLTTEPMMIGNVVVGTR